MARAWPHTPEVQSASSVPPGLLESGSGELSTGGPGGDRAHAGVWATQLVGQQGGRSQYPAAARGRVPVFRDKQVAGQRHRVG